MIYIGKIAKLKDRLFAYRAGIYLTAVFYLLIVVAGERMVQYYIAFAVLKGVSNSFYLLGHFTMITDVTDNANRHWYLGLNLIITNIAMLAGPAAAGALVEWSDGLQGYTYVYSVAFMMFAFAAANSLKMKPQRPITKRTT
ncbi:MFS transporter [Paenibacillus alkalitolerans]|uniref:MFS transporter n=1 Tax=Paenibacillus alkalitolerans TaxID=2799335 RepID=UPI001F28C67B|nr:MFS transporter [Paenibacillus alkalitolerans]